MENLSAFADAVHTWNTFPFTSNGIRLDETLPPGSESFQLKVPRSPLSISPDLQLGSNFHHPRTVWVTEVPVGTTNSIHRGHRHAMPVDSYSAEGTREPDLLDTKMWSPYQSLTTGYTTPFGSQTRLMNMMYDASTLPFLTGPPNIEPIPHTFMHATQSDLAQVLIPEFDSAIESYHDHTDFGAEHDHHRSLTSTIPPASLSSTKYATSSVNDKKKHPPVSIYHPAERKGSIRPRSQRVCAINIDGIWIDKEELRRAAEQDKNVIVVHECQWANDGVPCDMWIVGSRPSVGAHVRKWHGYPHMEGRATCMWDGCKKTMKQGSISRHVVTAHLEERFHCQGCEQTFSRRDVYGQHVDKEEACKGIGAKIMYGTERRVIDIHEALQQEGALRYPD